MIRAVLACRCTIYATYARIGQGAYCHRHGATHVVSVG